MSGEILKKGGKRIHEPGKWLEAKRLYQDGLTLEGVGEKLGIPYPTVRYHAWVEDWGVRTKAKDAVYQATKAKRIRRILEKEEKRLEEELVVVKTADLEILAKKSLAADSARAKVAVSQRVSEILERLQQEKVGVKEAAQTLQALAPVIRLVHGWHREAEIEGMKGAINLALIATSPEELRRLGSAGEAQSSLARERREESETE